MKLHSQLLELRIVRTITSIKSQKESAKIFASVRPECFFTAAGRESYARVMGLLKARAELVSWDELCVDPVLSERVRNKLQATKAKPISADKIHYSIKLLNDYRQLRVFLEASQNIVKVLKQDKVDVEQLYNQTAEKLLTSRSAASERKDWFVHVGMKNDTSSLKLVKKTLQGDTQHYIPTGFKAFDDRNVGLPRGGLFITAATTGGGKSILCGQLAENMAEYGARVCVVPLEMQNKEMLRRHLARRTLTSMGNLINPKMMSKADKIEVYRTHKLFHRRLQKKGSLLTFFNPQEDLTAEEIFFCLRPFGYDVILIDYVGLLKGVDGDDQWQALRKVTRFSKRYADINDILVGELAQLSAEGLLRYSKGMQEDASNMWSWVMTPQIKESGIVPVTQNKARDQADFPFPLYFDWQHMRVSDLTEDQQSQRQEKSEARKDKKDKRSSFGKAREKVAKANSYFDLEEDE